MHSVGDIPLVHVLTLSLHYSKYLSRFARKFWASYYRIAMHPRSPLGESKLGQVMEWSPWMVGNST
ncbi:hypothetical protein DAI22_06g030600 [Oryza sativa Japonica Group]|jgi:hypothetical protein|nr:hypothetical protein DAI22_06g030600 [Oryza sativa Japonica Group]